MSDERAPSSPLRVVPDAEVVANHLAEAAALLESQAERTRRVRAVVQLVGLDVGRPAREKLRETYRLMHRLLDLQFADL